jgi:RHS repeat-associated protein
VKVDDPNGKRKGSFGYAGGAGYQEDETGLQLLLHRYYDPSTGRFLTRDPIKDGRNWYGYCGNNPVNCIDADGLEPANLVAYGDNSGILFGKLGFNLDRPVPKYGDKDITEPSKAKLIDAMIECEGDLYFFGHGSQSGALVLNSKNERLTQEDLAYIAEQKKKRGKKKMRKAILRACHQGEQGKFINSWLGVAEEVTAVCGLTARLWPPKLATPRTFKTPQRPGPMPGDRIEPGGKRKS